MTQDPQIIVREDAREQGLIRYFTGEPCIHGHVVERRVSSGSCIECKQEQDLKYGTDNREKVQEQKRQSRADPEATKERGRKRRAARQIREDARALGLKYYVTGEPCKRGHVTKLLVSSSECVECIQVVRRADRLANPEKFRDQERKYRVKERKDRLANPEKFKKQARKRADDSLGQLRNTTRRIACLALDYGVLGYDDAEYVTHLESTLPNGMTFDDAREAGYHVDHIVPLTIISDACPMDKAGRGLAALMAQDLNNLQMIPGTKNQRKNMSFNTEEQRRLFDVLCSRYLPKAA